jgi:hypothetical protein
MASRLRDAMSDMAETIRRVFQDPPSHGVQLTLPIPGHRAAVLPTTRAVAPPSRFEPVFGSMETLEAQTPLQVDFKWEARLQEEAGWGQWATGATVCVPGLFHAEKCARLEVPPLPRKPRILQEAPQAYRTRALAGLEPLPPPRSGAAPCALAAPRAHRALDHALSLPVAFTSQDIAKVSKVLWMRYTLKLVRDTGENIRNLDVVGLYRIPARGVRQVNHQASTGRLLVHFGPEAEGAPKAPFILARRKDDDSIVCCFVEDV